MRRHLCSLLITSCLIVLVASSSRAVEVNDPLSDPKKTGWTLELTEKSGSTITASENGAVLKGEWRNHILLTKRNDIVGTDANPLDVRVWCISEGGFGLHPGLHLYWDNQNIVSILYTLDNHVYLRWCNQGNDGARDCYNVAPDSKNRGIWLRYVLTSHNVFMFFSMDGQNWQRLGDPGGRPGREGTAPWIILGRGWQGDKGNKDAHGQLCNDYYPDGNKNLIASTFKNFSLRDAPVPLPQDELKIEPRDSWEEAEEGLEIHGTPKTWTLLGPRPDVDFKLWRSKDDLEPDKSDRWAGMKDEKGRPFRMTEWTRKDEDRGCYVDMGELLEPNAAVLAWARTEIDWPMEGPANLFFDDNGRATVFLNDKIVFTDQGRDPRQADKDRFCVPVHMNRGKNSIKVKIGQMRGDWGFFLRIDRTDIGHRIQVLEKLSETHEQEAAGWRGAQAMFEIARRYEQLNDFANALSAWQKSQDKFATNDELRVEAFSGKVRLLASLRNWDALATAGDEYLKKYGHSGGEKLALDACVTGETLLGKYDVAEARVNKWLENISSGAQVDWAFRMLAGDYAEAGQTDRQLATLEKLAARPELNTKERVCAAFEAAFRRYSIEQWRAGRGEKPDPARITAACQAAKIGLALLPGKDNPQVQAWMKEAEDDLKAGKHERALAGYWGASLLAYAASDPQSTTCLALTKAYKLPVINIDPKTNKPRDLDEPLKKESWKIFTDVVSADVKMPGKWKAIGPFDFDEKNPPGPERDPNPAAKFPGRGGEKAWVEVDPDKTWNEGGGGTNLGVTLGDCKNGCAYVCNDIDVAAQCKVNFGASARAGWTAWLDGKIIATKGEDGITVDQMRVPVELTPGKHHLLMRLFCHPDGMFTFRAGFGIEPEVACHLLRAAWLQREYPDMRRYTDLWGELRWMLYFCQYKITPQQTGTFGETLAFVYQQEAIRWDASQYAYDYMKRCGLDAEAAVNYRFLLRRLETNSNYGDQGAQIWACTQALYQCLANSGESLAADEVLRDFIALHPDYYGPAGYSVVARGILREDFALSQASRQFFERAVREYPSAADNFRFAPPGLAFAKKYLPDRLIYNTSDDVQSAVDAASHLMKTGDPADIEKAMSKLGEVVRSNSDGLIRFSESRLTPRHVGVREYVRAVIANLSDEMREVYVKTVAASSELALKKAIERKDIPALEGVAASFHSTPAAIDALNLAGNLYLDRGNALQAAAAFRALARQNRGTTSIAAPLLAAKTARALLLGGQLAAAREATQPLSGEFAAQTFIVGGQSVTGAQYAQILNQQIDRLASAKSQNPDAATETHLGSILRAGPPAGTPAPKPGEIAWARPLLPSASMDGARWRFSADPFVHLQAHPAVSKGRALITSVESIQSIDLESGRSVWQQSWDSVGTLVGGRFTGFPISCPTVLDGKLYTRSLLGRRSAMQCFSADTGKPLWSTAEMPELRSMVWIGEPLIAYGLCIAPYQEPSDLNAHGVAALDASTGILRWKHILATGGTGIEVEGEFYGTTMQLGPAAAEDRTVYTATGLGSLAALNAITGETIWLSGYPRLHSSQWDYGTSGEYYTGLRARTMKMFARGAASPIITPESIILAPKDAPGLIAFDRRTGAIQWQNELLDARYLAGICAGNILTVDSTIRAIQISSGATAWEYSPGEAAYGQPGISGETIYFPTEERLHLVDARSGKPLSTHRWDPRIGPLGNLTIAGSTIVGVNDRYVAAIGQAGSPHVELPMPQAAAAVHNGTMDVAAAEFEKAIQSGDADSLYSSLNGRIHTLESAPQKQEGLGEIERVLNGKPAFLETPSELWKISRDAFAEALRARLGQPPPAPVIPPPGLNGMLSFSWHLDGENPMACMPADGPQDRFFAYAGTRLYQVRLAPRFEVLWQSYVGPGMTGIYTSANCVCVSNSQHVALFDRDTGEPLWHMGVPVDGKHRMRANARWLHMLALNDEVLAMAAGDGLFAFDARTGKELWSNRNDNRQTMALGFAGPNVAVCYMNGNDQPLYQFVHDAHTGNRIAVRQLKGVGRTDKWSVYDRFTFSPDRKFLYTQPYGVNRFMAFDFNTGALAWESDSLYLNDGFVWNGLYLGTGGPILHYCGGADNHWWNFFYEAATGKITMKAEGGRAWVDGDYLIFGDKLIARHTLDDKGTAKELWKCGFTGPYADFNDTRKVFVSNGKLYLLIVRTNWGMPDHFVLRTVDWQTGEHIGDQILAGTPIRNNEGKLARSTVEQRGNSLIYAAREGFFVYSAVAADTKTNNIVKLKQTLAQNDLPASQRRDTRRALSELEPPVLQISPAPPGTKLDLESGDPAVLESVENYVPLTDDAVWQGPQDLSAKIYSAWNGAGVSLAVDVKDDHFAPPLAGQALNSGDSIRVSLNGLTDPNVINHGETIVVSMAQVDGRTVINTEVAGLQEDQVNSITGKVILAPDGKSARYELFVPWELLRRDGRFHPGDRKDFRLGVAIYDNDGQGIKGAMEYGAAITCPALIPQWLGRVTITDISKEKIERYRKVIAKVPGAAQSMRFLQQIIDSQRGAKQEQDRIAELEEFVKGHPDCPNTLPALRLLRMAYTRAGGPDNWDKPLAFAKANKCPQQLLDSITSKCIRFWVLPDKANPPQQIMIQVHLKNYGWCRRAYWGSNRIIWGRDNTVECMPMGPLPKPGQWTQIELRAADLDMDGEDISAINFATFGGLTHFEQCTAYTLGKETLLCGEALPPKVRLEGNGFSFVAEPHHALAKSFTAGATTGVLSTSLVIHPELWFTFKNPEPAKPEPPKPDPNKPPPPPVVPDNSKEQALYRELAGVVPDTLEGLEFLQAVINLYPQEKRLEMSIKECEDYLSQHPETTNANEILRGLNTAYGQKGDHNPTKRCDDLIRSCKLPRDVCRVFYSQFSPTWMDWQLLGPFAATTDLRGQDQVMPPEKAVDLTWRTKAAGDIDVGWIKYSAAKDDKGKPNPNGFVDLLPPLFAKLDATTKGKLEKTPYFAYAFAKFNVPNKRKALLYYGVNDIATIWINGRRAVNSGAPGNEKDKDVAEITLNKGLNEILIKPGVTQGHLGFFVRISDENGRPIDDLTFP